MFDRILSVNNFFYTKNPKEYINELFRALKHGGTCIVSFSNITNINDISNLIDENVFDYFNLEKLNVLMDASDFKIFDVAEKKEENGSYFIVSMSKPKKIRFYR